MTLRTLIRTIASWINTRYTRKGKLLLISLAFSLLLSLDANNNNSYYIACLCLIFLTLAHIGSHFHNTQVRIKRDNLRPFNCGKENYYYIVISNLGNQTLQDLQIFDEYKLLHPDDMLEGVALNPENFEQSFTTNLCSTKTLIPELLAKSKSKIKMSFSPDSRGIINFSNVSLLRPESMGLCYSITKVKLNCSTLVTPKLLSITGLQNRVPESDSFVKIALQKQSGSFSELKGLKPYEIGDNLKRVHWKHFMRNNALVVKEFEKENEKYFLFFIDNDNSLQRAVIDETISVVWSLIYYFLNDSAARVKFFPSGGASLPEQHSNNIEKIGVFLSLLKSEKDGPIKSKSTCLDIDPIQAQFVVAAMSNNDDKRLECVKSLKKMFSGGELILIRNQFAVFPSAILDREKIKEWRFR